MEILLFWIIFAILVGAYAGKKGRSSLGYFFLALALSPLIAFLILLILGENRARVDEQRIKAGDFRKCPFCAELVKPEAIVCKHCGRDLPNQGIENEALDGSEATRPVNTNLIVFLSVSGFLFIYALINWI